MTQEAADNGEAAQARYQRTREKLKQLLIDGQLEGREVEVEITHAGPQVFDMMIPQGAPEGMENFMEMLQDLAPKRKKKRTVKVSEARRILLEQELDKLIDVRGRHRGRTGAGRKARHHFLGRDRQDRRRPGSLGRRRP